jgi:hypothetical protein
MHTARKRKADAQPDSNERLSKRLSLLNLEQNGQKLYVPVENAQRTDASSSTYSSPHTTNQALYSPPRAQQQQLQQQPLHSAALHGSVAEEEPMQVDNTKHKVYIYSLDDELSSSDSEAEGTVAAADADDRVVFLPDIEKHLRANRIPPHVLLGQQQPDLEDLAAKQLVLYQVPSSISVPEGEDSVRKAIIEARQRVRDRQEAEREAVRRAQTVVDMGSGMEAEGLMEVEDGEADEDVMELD